MDLKGNLTFCFSSRSCPSPKGKFGGFGHLYILYTYLIVVVLSIIFTFLQILFLVLSMHFDSIKNHSCVSKLLFLFFWPEISFGDVMEVKPNLEPK